MRARFSAPATIRRQLSSAPTGGGKAGKLRSSRREAEFQQPSQPAARADLVPDEACSSSVLLPWAPRCHPSSSSPSPSPPPSNPIPRATRPHRHHHADSKLPRKAHAHGLAECKPPESNSIPSDTLSTSSSSLDLGAATHQSRNQLDLHARHRIVNSAAFPQALPRPGRTAQHRHASLTDDPSIIVIPASAPSHAPIPRADKHHGGRRTGSEHINLTRPRKQRELPGPQ